jgi:hypothetical protein
MMCGLMGTPPGLSEQISKFHLGIIGHAAWCMCIQTDQASEQYIAKPLSLAGSPAVWGFRYGLFLCDKSQS